MRVLLTGPYGSCGTALIDHLAPEYEFTYLNRSDRPPDHLYGDRDTVVADVSEYDAIRPAFADQRAVVHLAANASTGASWGSVLETNVIGTYNVLEAARDAEVESVVFASSNHVMGLYEAEHAPEIYSLDSPVLVDHTDPVRPDSYYGVSKSFGEDLGRYYVENYEYPKRVYALRICSVRDSEHDHPYSDAERGVDAGKFDRGTRAYQRAVDRMKAMWQSRRDFAHLVDCCLRDERASFETFYGVSDNDRRWFDVEHARTTVGYRPVDNGEEWESPPGAR